MSRGVPGEGTTALGGSALSGGLAMIQTCAMDEDRDNEALERHIRGEDFWTIAQEIGLPSQQAAHEAYRRAMDRHPRPSVEDFRAQEISRLKQLEGAVRSEDQSPGRQRRLREIRSELRRLGGG